MKVLRVEPVWMDAYDVKLNLRNPQVTGFSRQDADSVIIHRVCWT